MARTVVITAAKQLADTDRVCVVGTVDGEPAQACVWKSALDACATAAAKKNLIADRLIESCPGLRELPLTGTVTR